jgi:hypothetical protein
MHALCCEVTDRPRSIVQTKWERCRGIHVRYAGRAVLPRQAASSQWRKKRKGDVSLPETVEALGR